MSRGFGYFVGAPIPFFPKPGQGPSRGASSERA